MSTVCCTIALYLLELSLDAVFSRRSSFWLSRIVEFLASHRLEAFARLHVVQLHSSRVW